jgi:hypothetical protein
MSTNITYDINASDLMLSQIDLAHYDDQNETKYAGVDVAAECRGSTCMRED